MRFFIVLLMATNVAGAVLSNDQISCTITQDGIQSISLAGRVVTTQQAVGLQAHQGFYANASFPPAAGTAALGPVLHSVLTSTTTGVTITEVRSNMAITYSYSLNGNDIEMESVLKNNDRLPFSDIMIGLPAFVFGPKVSGNLKSWDPSYLIANGDKVLHPSTWCPLAVSYARDENYGLALHCKTHFDKPSLFNAGQRSGANGVPPTVAAMTLYIQDRVQPGGQLVVDVTIHLTTDTSLASLLSSYLRDFHNFAPGIQYLTDDRPWLQWASFDASHVTPQNPLGYNGDFRRFDLLGGIKKFEDMVWPSVGVTQGTLFWQPQGYNPRDCEYRADFDVWPDAVTANMPALIAWYKANGLRFGICAPSGKFIIPNGPNTDTTTPLDGENASQMAILLGRYDKVTKLGVNAFYLDDFGLDVNCYHIMKQIRAHLGSAIPTYTEFTSDLLLAYSGVYSNLSPTGVAGGGPDGGTQWYDPETLKIFRMLYPSSAILTTRFAGFAGGTGGFPVSAAQFAAWRLSPMVEDYQARQYTVFFRELVADYINGNRWK